MGPGRPRRPGVFLPNAFSVLGAKIASERSQLTDVNEGRLCVNGSSKRRVGKEVDVQRNRHHYGFLLPAESFVPDQVAQAQNDGQLNTVLLSLETLLLTQHHNSTVSPQRVSQRRIFREFSERLRADADAKTRARIQAVSAAYQVFIFQQHRRRYQGRIQSERASMHASFESVQ